MGTEQTTTTTAKISQLCYSDIWVDMNDSCFSLKKKTKQNAHILAKTFSCAFSALTGCG